MTLVVLDPDGRYAADCPAALADAGQDLWLVTGAAGPRPGFAQVTVVERYEHGAAVELAVLDAAARTEVRALIALDPVDQVRAAGLREHLGLPGQRPAAAQALADPITAGELLAAAGIATTPREEVRRIADLYLWAHRWGYPLTVRRRLAAGHPVLVELADEAALRAAVAGGLLPYDPAQVAALTVEPPPAGPVEVADGEPLAGVLPADPGHPYTVETVRAPDGGRPVHAVHYRPAARPVRELLRAQAGLDLLEVSR
ncbi:hypothetical protein [Kitasatospora cheerisanensis]|uniref:ATP-grasp domain-containing protein n=1 Tax=Kitasatospora cheerisanensis KCTC 2395 TaxID=1348663 RepID=A0A066YRK7_9ACTN|nr:hypothetical protein [Kitasatospora cheerisanensis]KDN83877.1 hypothetical protein KCH_45260 [Kitasatospora cheerisanensis KCTC 2395]